MRFAALVPGLALALAASACTDEPTPKLPPELKVTSPARGTMQAGLSTIEVTGTVAPNPDTDVAVAKVEVNGVEAAVAVDRSLLAEGAEHDLYLAFQALDPAVTASCDAGDYASALKALATAKPVVDRYFDDVMVMTDDPAVRANRLALLSGVAATMNRVADISKL